ncbi:solute carrier family 25 member 44-like [Impatiens glandulifera]|uniref:solute carrier family 25 member 44-like n=1 Tax=Impatiens glandulifera TaxID=253017 RepID=UPI001FB14A13|nr:solute carrier family 25 member 44-like [Impatiens glandulifera]
MSLRMAEEPSTPEIHIPADIHWDMLDKSKFFFLGAALFSGVSATLYPIVLLKTRQQVSVGPTSCFNTAFSILRYDGPKGFYRGLGTSLMGTIPARALYMSALEITKSTVGTAAVKLGFSDSSAATVSNTAAGLTASMAAQLVWTPIDVVSQRLMVQGGGNEFGYKINNINNPYRYNNGIDAFRKIIYTDGIRGLYRGFTISLLTYAPSNAVWWGSYSLAYRMLRRRDSDDGLRVVAVQGLSAAVASGLSAIVTMPLDTVRTRVQVMVKSEMGNERKGKGPTMGESVRNLVREGGLSACYRGLGPRWASMSLSATTMITTYEFLKKLSAKDYQDS